MPSRQNKWYVLTGGPSSGKTTLIDELKKLGHATVPEAARMYFDTELAKGRLIEEIRKDEKLCQEQITKLKIELEKELPTNVLTFFDRGMHDSIAYMRHYGFEVEDWIRRAHEQALYQKVFLLEPLPVFKEDGVRTEGADFAGKIVDHLREAYRQFGMEPIEVPVMSVEERTKFILDKIEKDNARG